MYTVKKCHTCDVVFLPGQHDLWCTVVACGYITRHLRILNTSQTEIANLEIAVLIDQNVAWFLKKGIIIGVYG